MLKEVVQLLSSRTTSPKPSWELERPPPGGAPGRREGYPVRYHSRSNPDLDESYAQYPGMESQSCQRYSQDSGCSQAGTCPVYSRRDSCDSIASQHHDWQHPRQHHQIHERPSNDLLHAGPPDPSHMYGSFTDPPNSYGYRSSIDDLYLQRQSVEMVHPQDNRYNTLLPTQRRQPQSADMPQRRNQRGSWRSTMYPAADEEEYRLQRR